jgi:hypothetical protein
MREILIDNLIDRIKTGAIVLDNRYSNDIELEYKSGKQVLSKIKINPENIDDFNIKTGLRGYLLMEWIRQGNFCEIKYNQVLKPGKDSFDAPLLDYFTPDELELLDYKFFGKKMYNLDQNSFNLLIESLNYILEFCKKIIKDEKINSIKNIADIYQYSGSDDIRLAIRGDAINNLYSYIDLKKSITRRKFSKILGIDILENFLTTE